MRFLKKIIILVDKSVEVIVELRVVYLPLVRPGGSSVMGSIIKKQQLGYG